MYEELYRGNVKLLRYLAGRYATRPADVEDLMQEGFLGLVRAQETFDPSRGKTWASWAAWHIISEFRKSRTPPALSLDAPVGEDVTLGDLLPDDGPPPDERLLRDEIVRTVRESVDALKEGREIVQRTRLGGETLGQTAHDMGLAYRQAAALRRRAEKALRRDRRLRALVDEQTRFHAHKGVKAFLSDHTSVVEAAVIWREDHR